jgi:hypothetical protein
LPPRFAPIERFFGTRTTAIRAGMAGFPVIRLVSLIENSEQLLELNRGGSYILAGTVG